MKVWDIATLTCERTLKLPQRAESVCVWNDFVFVGADDARIWAFPDGDDKSVAVLKEHKLAVLAMAANDDLVFSGSFSGAIKIFGQTREESD